MWVMVMFDLPTDTKQARREYALFRKHLLESGFTMLQYSVYVRYCTSKDMAAMHVSRIKAHVPPDGEVRVLTVTEKQFRRMVVFWGKTRRLPEDPPRQLEFF